MRGEARQSLGLAVMHWSRAMQLRRSGAVRCGEGGEVRINGLVCIVYLIV